MSRTPWIFLFTGVLTLIILAGLNWLSRLAPEEVSELPAALQWVRIHVWTWILGVTVVGIVLQGGEKAFNVYGLQRKRIQGVLDQLVRDLLDNDPRSNRCTLFNAVRGFRLYPGFFLWRIWHQDDHLLKLRDIIRIRPWGLYAYAYARASGSKNPHSCAAFRVFRNKESDCEGVVGQVWVLGWQIHRNLPALAPSNLRKQLAKIRRFDEMPRNKRVARYARDTGIVSVAQLRARERTARHYMGTIIETPSAKKVWGVLLIDSVNEGCPFPLGEEGDAFQQRFETYARVLSVTLT